MLAQYHRWVFETGATESVAAFRKWVIQEAEFQTIAAETMHGLTGTTSNQQPVPSLHRNRNERTFFGESQNGRSIEKVPCQVCGGRHAIWKCRKFAQKSPTERWNIAKRSQLCFRSLDDGHYGKLCPNSRICEKTCVKKSTIGCCTNITAGLSHRRVTRRTIPRRSMSTQAKENHMQTGVHSRKIQLLLSRRGRSSHAHSKLP